MSKKLKEYFDETLAIELNDKIKAVYPAFRTDLFLHDIVNQLSHLELKGRVAVIADRLKLSLPDDYDEAVTVLLNIIGPPNPEETGMFTEYYWLMPVAFFTEAYGLSHFDTSINAIYEITQRNTGEYAIRPFIRKYFNKTMKIMESWSKDPSCHVRRLASEGCRPRLPWSSKLDEFIADPVPVFRILENLLDDPSLFVRKSVANNLGDILKDNFNAAFDFIKIIDVSKNRYAAWIIRHALRNENKKGNPVVTAFLDHLNE